MEWTKNMQLISMGYGGTLNHSGEKLRTTLLSPLVRLVRPEPARPVDQASSERSEALYCLLPFVEVYAYYQNPGVLSDSSPETFKTLLTLHDEGSSQRIMVRPDVLLLIVQFWPRFVEEEFAQGF